MYLQCLLIHTCANELLRKAQTLVLYAIGNYLCYCCSLLLMASYIVIDSVFAVVVVVVVQVLKYLESRCKVHRNAINVCQEILNKKAVEWKPISRNDVSNPIRDVDMVITVGGDGTLLHASHFLDDSVPVLGVNSDPTQAHEVFYPDFSHIT